MNYKLGSLFDGSGGFPLAGALCGVEPVWAAEVEPYPIAVTRSRFPKMRHRGDISKVNGAEIEPVDIITFGSPCQDLSVAGKRAGLKHEANGDEETTRSGLFMEAVRIIKEMRRATNGQYPRFALWENVPGAFSSNKGEDFRIVCEELIKIVEPRAVMPEVPKNGWPYADSYIGDGWSLAYRTFDAQYWGVPQRRRRIHLVADFRGERAREILFEREGVRGYFAQGSTPWQTAPADAQGRLGADDREGEGSNGTEDGGLDAVAYGVTTKGNGDAFISAERHTALTTGGGMPGQGYPAAMVPFTVKIRSGCEGGGKGALVQENKSATLATHNDQYLFQPVIDGHILDDQGGSVISVRTDGKAPTLRAQMGGHPPVVMVPQGADIYNFSLTGETAATLTTQGGGTASGPSVICLQGNGIDRADTAGCNGKGWREDASYTLNTIDRPAVVYAVDQGGGKSSANVTEGKAPTLCTTHGGEPAVAYGLDRASFNQGQNALFDFTISEEQQPTLTARGPGAVCCTTGSFTQATEEVTPTLMARDWKDPTVVCYPAELHDFIADHNADAPHQQDQLQAADGIARPLVASTHGSSSHHTKTVIYDHPHYIVRRLTPTECARLQGFADWWSFTETKDSLTDEEFSFWLEVRNTHAAINGREVKEYTKKQMLTWYNKLWTDSAEYKMWGNGIALPPALYCLQGIVDALNAAEEDDSWML